MGAAVVALLCGCSGDGGDSGDRGEQRDSPVAQTSQPLLSPVRTNLTVSGIFRSPTPGVGTQTAILVPDSTFFASSGTIATMSSNGYTLMDVDIDTSTGQRLYTAVFQSGVPSTQYWELDPSDFANKVTALDAQGIRLVSLRAYTSTTGQLLYSGVFQPGSAAQLFPGAMSFATLASTIDANKVTGYFMTSLAVYVSGGVEQFLGVWRSHPQNTNRSAIWVSGWNSLSKEVLSQAGAGTRPVTMAHWEFNGDRRYGGVWLDGTDAYDVVAATDSAVFQQKITQLAAVGKVPVRINIEHGYQPPMGLAASFNDNLDVGGVGYNYGISENGATTAVGGVGYGRAPWEAKNPGIPMTETTRLDVASVDKAIEAAAIFKLLESPTVSKTTNLDTPIMTILGNGALGGLTEGAGVSKVTVRDLLNMNSGLCDGQSLSSGTCTTNSWCDNTYSTNYPSWLSCVLHNCTVDGTGKCGTPPFSNVYNGTDPGVLRAVIETLSGQTIDAYLHSAVDVPMGVDSASKFATVLADVDCTPDLTTPTRPLYYARGQTSGPGADEQSAARDEKVCGSGGLQMTAAQANTFLQRLTHGGLLSTPDLNQLLSMWLFQPLNGSTTPFPLFDAPGYAKNGGYQITSNSFGGVGPTSGIVMAPAIDTQVAVFSNAALNLDAPSMIDPQSSIVDGLNRMYSYPLGTFSIVNQNSANFGPMCFNVSGGSTAQNASIVQWTCGTAPLATNEQFVQRDVGNGRFILQAVNSGLCVTVQFDDSNAGEIMLQYTCNGGSNQEFVFQPTGNGYGNLVVQNSGMCMTVSGGSNSIFSGQSIVQEPCAAGQSTQEFLLHPVDIVSVVNANSATFGPMCFNVSGGSTAQNASIVQWTCGPEPLSSNMEFRRIDKGNGLFSLQAINSGRCLTVHDDDSTPGETMVQYDCNGLSNQEFAFQPTSGGFGNIVAQNSGLCLMVSGGSNDVFSGQAIVQEPCTAGQSAQQFILEQQ